MTHTPDLTSGLAARTLAVIAEKLDLPDDSLEELGADAELSFKADLPRLRKAIQEQLPEAGDGEERN